MQHVKIPQDRVGVLIGDGGETMRDIESRAGVLLDIDSEDGAVSVKRTADSDPVQSMKGVEIVRAIGRGFTPADALRLLDDDMMMLDIVDIDAHSRNRNDMRRQKGRLIGQNGRTRELMAELSGANVVIYGSTLGAIGTPDQVQIVREAAERLLDGASHGSVYSFLERKHNELKRKRLEYHHFTD